MCIFKSYNQLISFCCVMVRKVFSPADSYCRVCGDLLFIPWPGQMLISNCPPEDLVNLVCFPGGCINRGCVAASRKCFASDRHMALSINTLQRIPLSHQLNWGVTVFLFLWQSREHNMISVHL